MDPAYYHEYAHVERLHWWFRGRRTVISSLMSRWLPPGRDRRLLDVGCGTGAMIEMLKRFGQVEGFDSSAAALIYCRDRLGPQVALYEGQLPDGLPSGETYDAITAFDVIEHIPEAVETLRALRDVLAEGGLFFCTVPAFQFLWGPHDEINHHCRRYTRPLLRQQLEAAGFHVLWSSYFSTLLFPPVAAIRLLRRVTSSRNEMKSDMGLPPKLLNGLLESLFSTERFLLDFMRLPFGTSVAAVATRSDRLRPGAPAGIGSQQDRDSNAARI